MWMLLRFSGTVFACESSVLRAPMVRVRFAVKYYRIFIMCLDERARVARVVRVWERALLTLKIALQLMGGV